MRTSVDYLVGHRSLSKVYYNPKCAARVKTRTNTMYYICSLYTAAVCRYVM